MRLCGLLCALILTATLSGCPDDAPAPSPAPAPTPAKEAPEAAPAAGGPSRVIVLGFDGVDPDLVQKWMDAGRLPHLKALSERGTFARLQSTTPPQSPVAWATFASGLEPGGHGIFDFIARNPKTYLPSVATVKVSRPEVKKGHLEHALEGENLRSGPSFWQTAGKAGVPGSILFVPYSFPPDGVEEMRVISGLGTPDLRGTNSSFQYLASETFPGGKKAGLTSGGVFEKVLSEGKGTFRGNLRGASLTVDGRSQSLDFPLTVAQGADGLELAFPEGHAEAVKVKRGEWSETITLKLSPVPGTTWSATTRAYPVPDASDPLALYFLPVSADPRTPPFAVSTPMGFAGELAAAAGAPFKTVGWVHETSGLSTEALDGQGFLLDLHATMEARRKILHAVLDQPHDRLTVAAFTATDRVAHMFYRLFDEKHPRFEKALADRHGKAIQETYEKMDAIVGEVVARLPADATLLIVSDHGFHSFRRGVNLNRWLVEKGYQTLKKGAPEGRDFFRDVDWSKTRAYAVGTGQIWLNLAGREKKGIVAADEAAALAREIAEALATLRDGDDPLHVVQAVHLAENTYSGEHRADAPDLTVSFAEGYRTGWGSILGGAPKALIEDNLRKWSGDHAASDPKDTEGFLVSNRKITAEKPAILDVAPTVLHLLGVDNQLPGKVWLP
ncbi:MAG: alkaline phosphatase family protein [Deltaproteobacteria bacterium]|nr:alkaline phosphatase family protein [Deltaproteobacteria bacterium]